jgi:hypothetical protein
VASRRGGQRSTSRDRSADDGGITAFVVLLLVALFALLGLVVDGGSALTAQQSAEVEAEQAARAGAGAISVDGLRAGVVEIDPQAAVAAAQGFMAASGHPGSATVSGGVVSVRLGYQVPTVILGIVGIDHLSVAASAAAVNVNGVARGTP